MSCSIQKRIVFVELILGQKVSRFVTIEIEKRTSERTPYPSFSFFISISLSKTMMQHFFYNENKTKSMCRGRLAQMVKRSLRELSTPRDHRLKLAVRQASFQA